MNSTLSHSDVLPRYSRVKNSAIQPPYGTQCRFSHRRYYFVPDAIGLSLDQSPCQESAYGGQRSDSVQLSGAAECEYQKRTYGRHLLPPTQAVDNKCHVSGS